MTRDISDFLSPSCTVLALGEPTHSEPAVAWLRNDLFARLAGHGFAAVALETDRVAALMVDDYVRRGVGDLDTVLREGFSHGFGAHPANRALVTWMREYNEALPPRRRLAFHGFDAPLETMSAPSPRRYLEAARAQLNRANPATSADLDAEIDALLGADERWSRTEAVLDPAASPGRTPEAERLRAIADDLTLEFQLATPNLLATGSRHEWHTARTHLLAAVHVLRYHAACARRVDEAERLTRMCATRDACMAENLADIRRIESARGATLVFAHNLHLQRNPGSMPMGEVTVDWFSAGALFDAAHPGEYRFLAGALGRSADIGLGDPGRGTYEAALRSRIPDWGLTAPETLPDSHVRDDIDPRKGYFPLDRDILGGADGVLFVADCAAVDEAASSAVGVPLPITSPR
ncbi:MAG TPA: erythromycin esterase family protein [Nocardia sp.]|uniref:erythromycin esterase family protein n=1 Tax=Nocardia TaxID=1817 RepID=UPI002457E4EF|nr:MULTISPECIES: erythromycin esterase family protein [Nocardia]HLS78712.1 erythromycin esterase family protein [Nocardia sp.]